MAKSPGQKLRRQRKMAERRAAYDAKVTELRTAGACCGNCRHYGRVPVSKERCCDLESDFHGYAITTADRICDKHQRRESEVRATPSNTGLG